MPANLENSVVATGLEKVSVQSNLKERQCQRIAFAKIVQIAKSVQTTAQLHSSHMLVK